VGIPGIVDNPGDAFIGARPHATHYAQKLQNQGACSRRYPATGTTDVFKPRTREDQQNRGGSVGFRRM
jgi:hypothetical protein